LRRAAKIQFAQIRNAAVTLAGTMAFVILANLAIVAGFGLFEVDHPTLFARLQPLWSILSLVVPGLGIGLFVTRRGGTPERRRLFSWPVDHHLPSQLVWISRGG